MEIYIEDILLSNSLITFIQLSQIKTLFSLKKNYVLFFIASLIGAVITLIYPLLNLDSFILIVFKLLIMFLITKIAFLKENPKNFLTLSISFLFYSFMFSGFVKFFNPSRVNAIFLIIPLLFISVIVEILKEKFVKRSKISTFLFKTEFVLNGKTFESLSFMDSGNSLKYKGNSLMIVNLKLLLKFFPKALNKNSFKMPFKIIDYIDYNSVNSKGKIYITKLEKIVIYNGKGKHIFNDIAVGVNLNNFDGYDMLFSMENFY